MSHFTVLVKVKKDRLGNHGGDLGKAVAEMLAPYQENNMGDCPKEFLTFHDMTEEIEKDKDKVVEPDSYLAEKHPEAVGKTLLDWYGGYETYVSEYHGYRKDEETGRYGYWENPNAKWDWYQVGGRWRGLLPVRAGGEGILGSRSWTNENEPDEEGHADAVQVKDLDLDRLTQTTTEGIERFWTRYERWKQVKDKPPQELEGDDRWLDFDMHDALWRMGLRKCVKERAPVFDAEGKPVMEEDPFTKKPTQVWSKPEFEDTPFTKEDLYAKYRWHFEWSTFAVLDDAGWHEKGKMGWWACSSDTLEDREQWGQSYFQRFLADEDPETTLVVVDCHI